MASARLLAPFVGAAIALHRATLRVEQEHQERFQELRDRRVPILFALWHGRMFLSIQAHRHQGIVTMASRSGDGAVIARWLETNGYRVARGSTTRGGGTALREMVREMRSGRHGALTVDGPQGPPRVVQPGVVQLARLTGAWILPITFSSARPKFLSSWDRYLVPKPFSKNVVLYGEAFPIPRDLPDAEALSRITAALDTITREADERLGVTPPSEWTR